MTAGTAVPTAMAASRPDGPGTRLVCTGPWVIAAASAVDPLMRAFVETKPAGPVLIDLSAVTAFDTVGAWLVHRTRDDLAGRGVKVEVQGLDADRLPLLEAVDRVKRDEPVAPRQRHVLHDLAERTGRATFQFGDEAVSLIGFLGVLVAKSLRAFLAPRRIRFRALAYHIEHTGLTAMPIVGLLSFLIGVVLAYQGADQLRQFGAQIFVVNLLGVSILRELGILLTAIIVAGRSGSAFTAQIGTMKVNLEVDAMQTLGLDPVDILVIPRVLALVITLPILAFYASMMAIFGGALMANATLDISFQQFARQFQSSIAFSNFWTGILKAPIFAFTIALVGCYEGLKVSGSAESVGRLTTQSVVVSIFLVIVLDALFSVVYSMLGV
jgi:phospholipid/cholesterol/gamma-HCH transport system permease protein